MAAANRLPQFKTCIDLYLAAYDRYGTDSFTAEQLDREVSIAETPRVLELAVAYGLIAFDETAYRVTCDPDATSETWQSVARDRASLIRETIADRDGDDVIDAQVLRHEANEYASVFVTDSDDLDSIVNRLDSLSLKERDGVVLRAPGNDASRIQRFADRLCDDTTEPSLSIDVQKEYSDVVGEAKTELEFQLFLKQQ